MVRILHVSPHPDDELIGAPATLMALRDAGHEVTNLATSLGRTDDHDRRRQEVTAACEVAGFRLLVTEPPVAMSRGDDLTAAEARIRGEIEAILDGPQPPEVVVGPSPHDVHHGHELTSRAIRDVLSTRANPPVWWIWAIWGDLPLPTIITIFDDARAEEIARALSHHAGEMARTDHRVHVEARGRLTAVTAAETVFGFGTPALTAVRAEVLTEVVPRDGDWVLGSPRTLNPRQPLVPPTSRLVGAWLTATSPRDLTI
ncbi:MAG: hypothetical protein EXQ74_02605 [Thermoleophilia bacterium]|nr:hypothetical protein [Thermoleophilia bacterium]